MREVHMERLVEVEKKIERRANYSVLALISFIAAFAVARTFTSLSGFHFQVTSDIHFHHYWYGIIMVGIGGWLGINYNDERINRIAAIIYGTGGGLIGDEVGMLLEMNPLHYWTIITYPIVVGFLAFCLLALLFRKHTDIVRAEIDWFTKSKASALFAFVLAGVSIVFLASEKPYIVIASASTTAIACVILVAYGIRHRRSIHRRNRPLSTPGVPPESPEP
jgi:uncharacterized membrane protein YeiH